MIHSLPPQAITRLFHDSHSRKYRLFILTIQECYRLRTGYRCVRTELMVSCSACDSIGNRPCHSGCVVCAFRNIREAFAGYCRTTCCAPLERHCLRAGYRRVRTECGIAGTCCYAVGYSPKHRVVIIITDGYVCKGIASLCCRRTGCTPQECYHLRT